MKKLMVYGSKLSDFLCYVPYKDAQSVSPFVAKKFEDRLPKVLEGEIGRYETVRFISTPNLVTWR